MFGFLVIQSFQRFLLSLYTFIVVLWLKTMLDNSAIRMGLIIVFALVFATVFVFCELIISVFLLKDNYYI